jgi:hypothetical protein
VEDSVAALGNLVLMMGHKKEAELEADGGTTASAPTE